VLLPSGTDFLPSGFLEVGPSKEALIVEEVSLEVEGSTDEEQDAGADICVELEKPVPLTRCALE